MRFYQEDIDSLLFFLTEELNVDVVFDNDEPNAYWNSEHNQGHLFTNKEDTDLSYHMALITLARYNNKSTNILATHNNSSIGLGVLYNKKHNNSIFEFGHLLGMREKKYNEIQGIANYEFL